MADCETRNLLCTECGVPAQAVVVDGESNRVRCPDCGRESDLKQAMSDAAAYLTRNLLSSSFGAIRSKSVKVTTSPNPKPAFMLEV